MDRFSHILLVLIVVVCAACAALIGALLEYRWPDIHLPLATALGPIAILSTGIFAVTAAVLAARTARFNSDREVTRLREEQIRKIKLEQYAELRERMVSANSLRYDMISVYDDVVWICFKGNRSGTTLYEDIANFVRAGGTPPMAINQVHIPEIRDENISRNYVRIASSIGYPPSAADHIVRFYRSVNRLLTNVETLQNRFGTSDAAVWPEIMVRMSNLAHVIAGAFDQAKPEMINYHGLLAAQFATLHAQLDKDLARFNPTE